MTHSSKVPSLLLDSGAVSIRPDDPFVFSSGTISPIYVNHALLISDVNVRNLLVKEFEKMIRANFDGFDAVACTAGGSVPWGTLISDRLSLPLFFVRKNIKQYAHNNEIEGHVEAGWRVLLVEHAISTSTTIDSTITKIRKAGCTVSGLASIFDYELAQSKERLSKQHVEAVSLAKLSQVVKAGVVMGLFDEPSSDAAIDWSQQPQGWHQRYAEQIAT